MPQPQRTAFPEPAVAWMLGDSPQRVLDLGSGRGGFASVMTSAGHQVFALDRDPRAVSHLSRIMSNRLQVAAQAEALPYVSASFDLVTSAETLQLFAPGLVGAEIARVLRPGGQFVAIYNTRDDTVPWVKKLARIMQARDPEAMRGDYGQDSVLALADTPYFTDLEQKNFRNWMPIDRPGLLQMVNRRPSTAELSDDERERLLAEVGDLYDSYARVPDPLLLPFQASCWRATVDHSELKLAGESDQGLEIPLGF